MSRSAKGIEGALVDHTTQTIRALDPADPRKYEVALAEPAALLIAKVHEITERTDSVTPAVNRVALDVLRLLRTVPSTRWHTACGECWRPTAPVTSRARAVQLAGGLLRRPDHTGPIMTACAAGGGLANPDMIAASLAALYADVADELRQHP